MRSAQNRAARWPGSSAPSANICSRVQKASCVSPEGRPTGRLPAWWLGSSRESRRGISPFQRWSGPRWYCPAHRRWPGRASSPPPGPRPGWPAEMAGEHRRWHCGRGRSRASEATCQGAVYCRSWLTLLARRPPFPHSPASRTHAEAFLPAVAPPPARNVRPAADSLVSPGSASSLQHPPHGQS